MRIAPVLVLGLLLFTVLQVPGVQGANEVQVTYQNAGAGTAGTGNLAVAYPGSLQANDLLLLQVGVRDTTTTPTTPGGFAVLIGPDNSGTGRQWIYYKIATGSESGTLTVTIGGAVTHIARMYSFRNTLTASFSESGAFGSGTSLSITMQSVTTSRDKCLAVSFAFEWYNSAIADATGESGGNWAEPVAEYSTTSGSRGAIQLQTGTMATTGTISGGTSVISGTTNRNWGCRSVGLKANRAYTYTPSLSLTMADSTTRFKEATRSPTLTLSLGKSTTRGFEGFRSASLALTVGDSTSKLRTVERGSTLSFSIGSSSVRSREVPKSGTLSITLSDSTSRLREISVAVSVVIGFVGSLGSRVAEFTRVGSLVLSLQDTVTRSLEYVRASSLVVSLGASASRLIDVVKSASLTLSLGVGGGRLLEASRVVSLVLGLGEISSRIGDFSRAVVASLEVSDVSSRIWETSRVVSLVLGLGEISSRVAEMYRDVSLALGVQALGSRLQEISVAVSLALGLNEEVSIAREILRSASLVLEMVVGSSRLAEFERYVSQVFEFTLQGLEEISGRIFEVAVSLTLQVAEEVSRLGDFSRWANLRLSLSSFLEGLLPRDLTDLEEEGYIAYLLILVSVAVFVFFLLVLGKR